jgi:hypothetical protein
MPEQSQERLERGSAIPVEPKPERTVLSWPSGVVVIAVGAGAARLIVFRLLNFVLR